MWDSPQIAAPGPSLSMAQQQKGQRVAFCHHTCVPSASSRDIRPTGTARPFLPGLRASQGTCPFPWKWHCQHPARTCHPLGEMNNSVSSGRRTHKTLEGLKIPARGQHKAEEFSSQHSALNPTRSSSPSPTGNIPREAVMLAG